MPSPDERVAFVLSGGATRGAVQVGMLLALTESGIVPDFVIGTSVGALNGAVYSASADAAGLQHLAELWEVAPRAQIFPFSPLSMLKRAAMRNGYLLPNDGLRTWIESQSTFDRLEDFPIPLHVVTTDVATRESVVLSEGHTVTALLASSAIPRVFPPIEVGDQLLCDGAIAADTPIAEAAALGATTLYVLPTMSPSDLAEPPPNARARGLQLLDQLFGAPASSDAPVSLPGTTIHWLSAGPVADANPFTFRASRRLIDQAYQLTRQQLTET